MDSRGDAGRAGVPISIYVLHHEKCRDGSALAESVFDWFRGSAVDLERTGAGIPTWFRTRTVRPGKEAREAEPKPADDDVESGLSSGPWRLEPSINLGEADLNVLVLLVDEHMVASRPWREALRALLAGEQPGRLLVLPVQLHWSLTQVPFLYEPYNPIRIDPRKPPEDEPDSDRLQRRTSELRRWLTDAIARELRHRDDGTPGLDSPPPLDVFLSHAKDGGRRITEELRATINQYTQLIGWYDERDLPSGRAWEGPMREKAGGGSAALLAVVTDLYSTRYWCRQELNAAREPRPATGESGVERVAGRRPRVGKRRGRVWRVVPTVQVVARDDRWGAEPIRLAGVPARGWKEGAAAEILDRLVLEVLLARSHELMARKLREDDPADPWEWVTWVPDSRSARQVIDRATRSRSGKVKLAHPGRGLQGFELDELRSDLNPRRDRVDVVLKTYDDVRIRRMLRDIPTASSSAAPPFVGLSAGGVDQELAPRGISMKHVDDALVRIARALLSRGCRLAFGGTLSIPNSLTESLIATAASYVRDSGRRSSEQDPEDLAPLVNYAAWPFDSAITDEKIASNLGVCRFVRCPRVLDGAGSPLEAEWDPAQLGALRAAPPSPEKLRLTAKSLSWMREWMVHPDAVPRVHARVVLAGKIHGWSGAMPGIAEEVLTALEHDRPVYILGGFGGCAGELAKYLRGSPLPESLTFDGLEASKSDPSFCALVTAASDEERSKLKARFGVLKQRLDELRTWLNTGKPARPRGGAGGRSSGDAAGSGKPLDPSNWGLSPDAYRELLETTSVIRATALLIRALGLPPDEDSAPQG